MSPRTGRGSTPSPSDPRPGCLVCHSQSHSGPDVGIGGGMYGQSIPIAHPPLESHTQEVRGTNPPTAQHVPMFHLRNTSAELHLRTSRGVNYHTAEEIA